MKKTTLILSLLASLAILLSACSAAAPAAQPTTAPATAAPTLAATAAPTAASLTLTDGLGREVTLAGPAQRIVSLAPSNTEILFAIGAGKQVAGRDDISDYPEEAKSLPTVGGNLGKLNLEAITGLQPDLVLASELNSNEQVKALEGLKLTVFYLKNPTDLEGLYANLETVGRLTGRSSEAAALAASLKERVQKVNDAIAKTTTRPSVFYEIDASDPAKPWTAGPGTFLTSMIQMAGGENIGAGLTSAWAQISQEELLVKNPDIILLGDAAYGITAEQVGKRPAGTRSPR